MSAINNFSQFQKIRTLLSAPEYFSPLDFHFSLFIGRMAINHAPEAALAGALVSRSTNEGNICLDLKGYADKPLMSDSRPKTEPVFVCPPLSVWTAKLIESGVVGQDEGNEPLVLVSSRLYLRRYREYEKCIVRFIRQHADSVSQDFDNEILQKKLKKFFSPVGNKKPDWQQVAAIAALTRSFCVISGGPGTGKTYTVAKILALLTNQGEEKKMPRILLAAPTGKAASRLQQAIAETGLYQPGSETLKASTLHRLLGYIRNSPYFRHDTENPLAAEIIVIDEASMVDLPLMAKLMQAIPPGARLILLGDRFQLASVQPGSVLGDICSTKIMSVFSDEFKQRVAKLTDSSIDDHTNTDEVEVSSSLKDSFVELEHSYRFGPDSPIARLGRAVKEGDGERALDLLLATEKGVLTWKEIPAPADLRKTLRDSLLMEQFRIMQQAPDPDSCFNQLDNFRLLCGLRQGPFGATSINFLLEQLFSQQIPAAIVGRYPVPPPDSKISPLVRPVMVNRNDYNLQLYNGDIGIIMPDPQNRQKVRAYFRNEQDIMRNIAVELLPGHETVFAMTVHKSQGSEFNSLILILPDQDSPVLTRELLYTAITRAREKVEIWGRKEIFTAAVKRRIKRTSGLAEELWGLES